MLPGKNTRALCLGLGSPAPSRRVIKVFFKRDEDDDYVIVTMPSTCRTTVVKIHVCVCICVRVYCILYTTGLA